MEKSNKLSGEVCIFSETTHYIFHYFKNLFTGLICILDFPTNRDKLRINLFTPISYKNWNNN